MMRDTLPSEPWNDWVKRVVISVPHYFSPSGQVTGGGRQRKVRDISKLIREVWGRGCVVMQKSSGTWVAHDEFGTRVEGVRAPLKAWGDPAFGRSVASRLAPGDGIVYLGGEDAWPYFMKNAKAVHVGVWWDGPFPRYKKMLTAIRTESLFRASRSTLCVDTNVINWLRARGPGNQSSANQAVYVPNYADTTILTPGARREAPGKPLRILFARRYELKRGPELALDAVRILLDRGHNVRLVVSTPPGQEGLGPMKEAIAKRSLSAVVDHYVSDMNSIYDLYDKVDVSLVPTLWSEGTSYSCVESIVAGIPVATTTVGGLPNIVIPGFNGTVSGPIPEAVADSLAKFIDEDFWYQCRKNCISMRSALSKERWDRQVLDWLKA